MSKTRMGKRVASLLLSLVMMLSLLPTTVYATMADGAATNDTVVEETIAPVNAEGVDAVDSQEAESSGDEEPSEESNELVNFVTVNDDATKHETLDAAIAAATPDENGVITYNISGKVEVATTGWVQVLKSGLSDVGAVKFVGEGANAEICLTGGLAILADQSYDIDVSFENLTLSKPNPAYGGDYGHSTNYFTTWLRNTGAAENTVTYTNCTFPNGVCNNQYGKTVFNNCQFTNTTTKLYNLWVYGGNVELNGGKFSGTRGAKVYTEGTPETAPTVTVENTSFDGLTEKAAIVVSKAATVTLTDVSATGCGKGLFQKDIEGSTDAEKVTIAANGTGIGGTFSVTAEKSVDAAKNEFNITAGTFTGEVSKDYLAEGFTIDKNADGSYGVTEEVASSAVAKIGETGYETLDAAITAVQGGETIVVSAGEYKLNGSLTYTGKAFAITAAEGAKVSFDMSAAVALHGAKITFNGVTFDYKTNGNYIGLQHTDTLVYNDCTINGMVFLYATNETFNRCTFNQTSAAAYNVWTYGAKNVAFNSCAFNCVGKAVLVYNEGTNTKTDLTVKNTEFKASAPVEGKAAIEIDTSLMKDGTTITIDDKTTAEGFAEGSNSGSTLWNDKKQTADTNKNTTVTVADETVFAPKAGGDGTEANPYTLEQLGAMTRAEYVTAQERLGGTMYVTVGEYSYATSGVLGNGVRDDTTGQIPDHSMLNAYGENGYLGEKNDGANGKNIVFVNGSITSGATGYASIDNIGTDLLLAVPAYTDVTFKGITFNNVMSFNYQLYTSPWSQLGELKFDECTFNGIIVGSIAAQTLTFNGCTFNGYTNSIYANNSNPTWIRPAYGNWTKGDNEGQGDNFQSLTTINFTGNKVTSTRPVKFEYISQWDIRSEVTATGNYFDISAQEGDKQIKNVGLYLGAHTDANAFDLVVENNTKSDNTAALYTIPEGKTALPLGSTVKNIAGEQIELEDALKWKAADEETGKIVLKTVEAVASVGDTKYASLTEAVAAAQNGETVTLLADATEDVTIDKSITLDLGGKTLTNTNAGKATISVSNGATAIVKNGSVVGGSSYYNIEVTKGSNANLTLEDVTATAGNTGSSMIDNWGTLTINSGEYTGGLDTVKSEEDSTLTINGGTFTLDYWGGPYTAVILNYGMATITGGTFIQNADGKSCTAQNVTTGYTEGHPSKTTVTGGTFINNSTKTTAKNFHLYGKAKYENIEISGGLFNKTVSENYFAAGFELSGSKNSDGYYFAETIKRAKITKNGVTTKYDTLEAAYKAAEDGDTITLIKDVTLTEQFKVDKAITLNLAGKTLTSTWEMATNATGADRYAILINADATIKGTSKSQHGNIVVSKSRAIGAYAALTMRNVTVTQTNVGNEACVALCEHGATYTIENCTIDGSYAVANFANNATITIKDSALTGTGNTLYHNGTNYGLKLTVTNTTITSTGGCGVYISGSTSAQSNEANQNGVCGHQKATFTGCTISGTNGVEVKYTDLTLDGCTVEATVKTPSYTQNNNGPAGEGFAVVATDNAKNGVTPVPTGTVTITGDGKYTGPVGLGSLESVKTDYTDFKDETIKVSGGTFNYEVPEDYCADGFIPAKNEDGTYGVKEGSYVAETNGVKYETLQDAIDAAKSGATVTMLANTDANVTISTRNLTLDLNGYTLNGGTEKGKPALTVTARVTVKDSSEAQTGTIKREDTAENSGVSSHYVIDIQGDGWLIFEGGIVTNDSGNTAGKGASLVRIGDDSVAKYPGLTINGGTFTQDNFIAIKVDRGDLFLNDGTITSASSYAIEDWHRTTINGGTVNGTVAAWTYSGGANSSLAIKGGTINGDVKSVNYGNSTNRTAKVSISGGTVNGELGTYTYNKGLAATEDASLATIAVSGGTFDREVDENYCAEGFTPVNNGNGTYGVEQQVLAKIGDTEYYTMDAAFKAVKAGETIVMQRDYVTSKVQNSGYDSFTIDLNGHTWNFTSTDVTEAAFEINYPNVSLTVKNGTVVSGTMVGLIPSAMSGTITYDDSALVFEGVEMTANGHSGIETNGGNTNDTVKLVNSTLNVPNGFGIYFPSSGTLTIDNSTINAKTMGVQVCAGSLNITGDKTAITVTGDAVPKTEGDGAIEDGAAISIVNRTGYKGLEKIEVTGGTFESKVEAIKAYDWANNEESEFSENTKVAISGGTFSSEVPEDLCAEGYIPVANDDGTYTVKEGKYVAEYNGTKYETLQAAIDAASQKNGGQTEVTLLCDLTITETIVFAKKFSSGSVLLDLGGYTLTGEGCRALQINKGNLYLQNGTVTSTGIINSSSVIRIGSNEDAYSGVSSLLYMQKDAKVVAPDSYGVTIFCSKTVSEKLTVASNASIVATGDSPAISGSGDKAYHVDGKGTQITITGNAVVSAENNYAIYHPDNGTLDIQGGTVSGKGGIQMCSGTLKISGSPKIEAIGQADHETGAAGPIYDIAAISAVNRGYPGGAPVVTIKGTPTVTANEGEVIHAYTWSNNAESEWAEAGENINVSGGTYSKTFDVAYLAADCTLVEGENGTYTVEQKPVAEYNGTKYTSLSQAILDANNSEAGGTVKLLENVTLTSSLGIGGTAAVTLDLNKNTLTLDGAQLYTQGSATVTIQKGTIKRTDEPTSGSASNFAIQVMSGSTLLLGGTQTTNKLTLEGKYGIYNVGGLLNVRYADITTDGWSIAVNDSASKTGSVIIGSIGTAKIVSKNGNCIGTAVNSKPNVTISKGTLTSNGTAWDAGVVYWASEGTLTITGGTFNASSAEGSTAAAVYQKNGTVKISGTTTKLLGNNALVVKAGDGSADTMVTELSAGTYSTKPEESWVVEGKEIHEVDGLYKVEGPYVVEVTLEDGTTTSYDAWSKLASVWNKSGATIKLLKDTTTSEIVATNGDITIDFNGKTLTVTKETSSSNYKAAIVVQLGGKLTLKDSSEAANGGMTATNIYGVEVITGSSVTVMSGSYNCDTSVVQVDDGTAYIKGGTFQTEAENKSYLLNCIDEAFKAGTAKMEVTGGTFYGFDPSANPEGEGTTYVKDGYVSTNNGDGTYTVEEYLPVEVRKTYNGTAEGKYATIEEAVENLDENKWMGIVKDYTLNSDFTIPVGVFLDVTAGVTLTVAEGVTLTVAEEADRLGIRKDATLLNHGAVLVCGKTASGTGRVTLFFNGQVTGKALTVPEGYFLGKSGSSYYAAEAFFEVTYADNTTKMIDADGLTAIIEGATKVTLLKDVTDFAGSFNSKDKPAENFVLDLGGHTLKGKTTAEYVLSTSVPMTIQNGTIQNVSTSKDKDGNFNSGALYTSADVTIEKGVTIDGGVGYAIWTDGYGHTLTVNGTVKSDGGYAITGNGSKSGSEIAECNIVVNDGATISADKGVAIYHPEKGTVTINGGTISGNTGVQMCSGELFINGGTITASGTELDIGNDGGILDGAAVSIINRGYPGGVPTATISGGTFTSADGIAAVQAYAVSDTSPSDWTDVDQYVNISGGTFSSIPDNMAALCKIGYVANQNTDGTYIVEEGRFTVQLTSRTVDSESPVANVSGGGEDITYEKGTVVTAASLSGYNFVGWYLNEYTKTSTPVSEKLSFLFQPTANCKLIAVYEPVEGGTFELKVDASKFKVNGGATNTSKFSEKLAANSLVTIKFTGDNFLYWVNGSGKVVSTLEEYTFPLVSATVLSAVYTNSEENEAQVIFLTANPDEKGSAPQIISSRAYAKDTTTISFPAPPVRIGKSFTGWSMTQEQIIAAIPGANAERGGKILVYAMYEDQKLPCTVTVIYGDKQEEITATIGTPIKLTAPQVDGKEFSYWKDSEEKVLGTTSNLYVTPVGNMTVYAVYGETVEQLPTISMLKPVASVANEKYVVTFSAVRSIPNGYTIEELGILYSMDSSYGNSDAEEYMVLGSDGEVPAGAYRARATQTGLLGTVRCNITTGFATRTFYARGYMILKDSEGNVAHYYSEIASGSYNSLTNGGN